MSTNTQELRDQLAGEYVIGALRGEARRRFEEELANDPQMLDLVLAWEARLLPLSENTAAVAPPATVRAQLTEFLEQTEAPAPGTSRRRGFWQSLNLWRPWALTATLASLALAWYLVFIPPAITPPGYIAVLQDTQAQPVLVATAAKQPWRLRIQVLQPIAKTGDQVLQLWAVAKKDQSYAPLLQIPVQGGLQQKISKEQWKLIKQAHSLVLTREPAGTPLGARPSGEVIYSGLCLQLSS